MSEAHVHYLGWRAALGIERDRQWVE